MYNNWWLWRLLNWLFRHLLRTVLASGLDSSLPLTDLYDFIFDRWQFATHLLNKLINFGRHCLSLMITFACSLPGWERWDKIWLCSRRKTFRFLPPVLGFPCFESQVSMFVSNFEICTPGFICYLGTFLNCNLLSCILHISTLGIKNQTMTLDENLHLFILLAVTSWTVWKLVFSLEKVQNQIGEEAQGTLKETRRWSTKEGWMLKKRTSEEKKGRRWEPKRKRKLRKWAQSTCSATSILPLLLLGLSCNRYHQLSGEKCGRGSKFKLSYIQELQSHLHSFSPGQLCSLLQAGEHFLVWNTKFVFSSIFSKSQIR